jgi:hypothetical protein
MLNAFSFGESFWKEIDNSDVSVFVAAGADQPEVFQLAYKEEMGQGFELILKYAGTPFSWQELDRRPWAVGEGIAEIAVSSFGLFKSEWHNNVKTFFKYSGTPGSWRELSNAPQDTRWGMIAGRDRLYIGTGPGLDRRLAYWNGQWHYLPRPGESLSERACETTAAPFPRRRGPMARIRFGTRWNPPPLPRFAYSPGARLWQLGVSGAAGANFNLWAYDEFSNRWDGVGSYPDAVDIAYSSANALATSDMLTVLMSDGRMIKGNLVNQTGGQIGNGEVIENSPSVRSLVGSRHLFQARSTADVWLYTGRSANPWLKLPWTLHNSAYRDLVSVGDSLFQLPSLDVDIRESLVADFALVHDEMGPEEFRQKLNDCGIAIAAGAWAGSRRGGGATGAAVWAAAAAVSSADCRAVVKETYRGMVSDSMSRDRFERMDRGNYDCERMERWDSIG